MSTSEKEELESADDDLVAYLDGELPADMTRRIEGRLAGDADYRDQLRELDQAWQALDSLPRTNAAENFARTTIAMVVQEAESDLAKRTADATKGSRLRRLRWVAVGLVTAAAGFTFASVFLPNQDTRLVKDLPVIRQVDLLTQVSDIEFLREISKRFSTEQFTRDAKSLSKETEAIDKASDASRQKRESWVRELSPEEKQELWAQEDRFYELTENRQNQLREMSQEIAADKDAAKLRETLVAYGQWLANKRENDQWQLRKKDLSPADRVAIIDQIVRREGLQLSEGEKSKLKAEIRAIAEEYKEAILKAYVTGGGEDPERFRKSFEQQSIALELYTLYWALNNEATVEQTRNRLADQLDPETRQFLASRSEEPRRANARDPLWTWIFEAMPMRGKQDPKELMRFFAEDLNNEQRKRLSDSPPAEFDARLTQLYDTMMMDPGLRDLESHIGLRFMGGRQGRGGGGGGDGQRGRRGGGNFGEGMQFGPGGPGGDMRGGPFDGGPRGDRGDRGGRGRGQRGNREGRGGPPDDDIFPGRRGEPGERGNPGERGGPEGRGPGGERPGPGEVPQPDQQDQPK